jgi:hypothetical protein
VTGIGANDKIGKLDGRVGRFALREDADLG